MYEGGAHEGGAYGGAAYEGGHMRVGMEVYGGIWRYMEV